MQDEHDRPGASRPSGRPQRLPVDPHPITSDVVDGPRRMAWLLATSRLLGVRAGALGREHFAARLRHDGLAVDGARLSRLESGAQRASLAVLAAYETHTGLSRGVLHPVDSMLARITGARPVTEQHQPDGRALDALVDAGLEGQAAGRDWLALAVGLAGHDRIYMHKQTWAELSTRLVSELTRSVGPAYVARHEASVTLLGHHQARRHLTKAIGRYVIGADAQVIVPALELLAEVGDDAAADLVVRLVGGDRAMLRHGATDVAATLSARGALNPTQLGLLEQRVGRQLAKGGPLFRRLDVLELAVELPEQSFKRILAVIPDIPLRRRALLMRRQEELVEADLARSVPDSTASRVERAVGRQGHDPDQMLVRLLREALFHGRRDRRHLAAVMLGVSPYASAVAQATFELTRSDDEILAGTSWLLLRRLGHVLTREEVGEHVLAERPHRIAPTAVLTLGYCGGPLPSRLAARLVDDVRRSERRSVRHAALFVLGMAGAPELDALAQDGPEAAAARWWLDQGTSIVDDHGDRRAQVAGAHRATSTAP